MASGPSVLAPCVNAVGFSEFWQQVHDSFPVFFDEASIELVSIGNEAFSGLLSRPIDKVARHISRIVWNSLTSVMVLALNGCGVDAMKIARGMFEASVTLGYLRLHPELVDDYLDFNFVIQKRRNDYLKDHAPEHLKRIPKNILEEIEDEFNRVAPRFRNRFGKVRADWSPVSLREMARAVGKDALYLTFYRFASSIHHCDVGGLFAQTQLDEAEDVLDVELLPSLAWVKEALITAHGAVTSVLRDYNEIAQVGIDELVERADSSFLKAWRDNAPGGLGVRR